MSAEDVQDAVPEKAAPEGKQTIEDHIVNVTAVTGMSMILGPDVVVGMTGLPDGSQSYVMLHLLLREKRRS